MGRANSRLRLDDLPCAPDPRHIRHSQRKLSKVQVLRILRAFEERVELDSQIMTTKMHLAVLRAARKKLSNKALAKKNDVSPRTIEQLSEGYTYKEIL